MADRLPWPPENHGSRRGQLKAGGFASPLLCLEGDRGCQVMRVQNPENRDLG